MSEKNVYLIGFMGAGKTAVGERLAAALAWEFVDTDAEIRKKCGGVTVEEIFRREGEAFFRDLEAKTVQAVAARRRLVVATGGGAVLREENVAAMRRSGTVVWLKVKPEEVFARLKGTSDRPLLADFSLARIKDLLAAREAYYQRAAEIAVETTGKSVEEVVREILAALGEAGNAAC